MRRFLLALIGLFAMSTAPVLAASAPPLEAYGRLPAIEYVSLSPSGGRLLSVGEVNGKRYLIARTLTGQVLVATPVDNSKVRSVEWVDEDHALVTVSATTRSFGDAVDRMEAFLIIAVNIPRGTAFILFDHDPKFIPFSEGLLAAYSIDGHPYAFVANTPREGKVLGSHLGGTTNSYYQRGYPDLWKIDLDTGLIELAAHGTNTISGWAVAPDGQVAAHALFDSRTSTWTLFHGQTLLMKSQSPRLLTRLSGLGRTPGAVVVIDQSGDEQRQLEIGADGQSTALFEHENVTGLVHDRQTGLLTGAIVDESRFKFFNPLQQARADAAVKPFSERLITMNSTTPSVDKVVLHTSGAGDSGAYWLIDLTSHRADIIDNDYPAVAPEQVGPVKMVSYRASDGLELDGVLTLPPGREAKGLPLVLLPHGGPIGIRDQPGFDWMAQAFASRGYAVFQPNYRGSGGHGAELEQAGFGEFGRKMLSDMADGVADLAIRGVIDPRRACIVGFSYGGYAAMAGITVQHGLYRCAVSGSGLSDLNGYIQWDENIHGRGGASVKFWREAMGVNMAGAPSLAAISPVTLAARADAPLLLIHGRDDSVVPLEQSERMQRAMKAAGKPVELLITDGEDHWLSHEASRVATLKAAVAFVEKHNPPN